MFTSPGTATVPRPSTFRAVGPGSGGPGPHPGHRCRPRPGSSRREPRSRRRPSSRRPRTSRPGASSRPRPLGGQVDGVEDLRVARASADIARQRLADDVVGRVGMVLAAGRSPPRPAPGCRNRTGRLRPPRTPPAPDAEPSPVGQRLDGSDLPLVRPGPPAPGTRTPARSSSHTEQDPHSPCSHAFFEPGSPSSPAQHRQQARARPHVGLPPLPVDLRPERASTPLRVARRRSASAHASARAARTRAGVAPVRGGPAHVVDGPLAAAAPLGEAARRPSVDGTRCGSSHAPASSIGARGERLRLRRPARSSGPRSRAPPGPLRVCSSTTRHRPGHRDDHGVARPDLGERAGPADPRPPRAQDQLVRLERGALDARRRNSCQGSVRVAAGRAHQVDLRVVGGEHRERVAGGRGGAQVASHRAPVPDLRGAHGSGRLAPGAGERRQLADDPGVGHARAEERRSSSVAATPAAPARRETSIMASGRRRSKFSSTMRSVPPAMGTDPGVLAGLQRRGPPPASPAGRPPSLERSARRRTRRSWPRTSSPSGYRIGHVAPGLDVLADLRPALFGRPARR